jgi:hypothetical protein
MDVCMRSRRRHSGMRRRDKIAKLFCAEGAGPESIVPQSSLRSGFRVRSLHSRPGMTMAQAIAVHLTRISRFRLICPSCQRVAGIFACDVGQITSIFPGISRPHEGRFAIVTKRWARDAVAAFGA